MTSPPFHSKSSLPSSVDASFRLWGTAQALARWLRVLFRHLTCRADLPCGPDLIGPMFAPQSGLPVAAHLTCVGASKAETLESP